MDLEEAGKKWNGMHEKWSIANQEARQARFAVTKAFTQCAAGEGAGPSAAQIELTEKLERHADELQLAEASFLKEIFG